VDTDPRQQRFVPHATREALARRVTLAKIAPEWEPVFRAVTSSAHRLDSLGAVVATGSHDVPTPSGLGLHWEMWSYVEGGMTPLRAIAAATVNGAAALGMSAHLGSLEPGKLADLVVMNANPLEDIRNSIQVRAVMLNGVLYNAETLQRISDSAREF